MRKWIARGFALCAVPLLVAAQLLMDVAEWVQGGRRPVPETPQPGGQHPKKPEPGRDDEPPMPPAPPPPRKT